MKARSELQEQRSLEYKRNHGPFPDQLVRTELVDIPFFRAICCPTEICKDKQQYIQDGSVKEGSWGRRSDGKAHVNQAFERVMGASEVLEPALTRKRVFLEARQISVAVVLLSTCKAKDCGPDYDLRCKLKWLWRLPRFEDCSCELPSALFAPMKK